MFLKEGPVLLEVVILEFEGRFADLSQLEPVAFGLGDLVFPSVPADGVDVSNEVLPLVCNKKTCSFRSSNKNVSILW